MVIIKAPNTNHTNQNHQSPLENAAGITPECSPMLSVAQIKLGAQT